MAEPPDSRTLTTPADLLEMILQLRAEVAGLRAENAALKDEIRRLKGLPPRPTLKPKASSAWVTALSVLRSCADAACVVASNDTVANAANLARSILIPRA